MIGTIVLGYVNLAKWDKMPIFGMKNRDNLYADFCTYGGINYHIGEFYVFNVPFFLLILYSK